MEDGNMLLVFMHTEQILNYGQKETLIMQFPKGFFSLPLCGSDSIRISLHVSGNLYTAFHFLTTRYLLTTHCIVCTVKVAGVTKLHGTSFLPWRVF